MMNLHGIVRQAVNNLHPEVSASLYQAAGQETGDGGKIGAKYAQGIRITAQMQSEGPTALYQADRVGMEEVNRKFYLYSGSAINERVAGIVRPLSRGGDILRLEDGTWWLVNAVIEDFTRSGWVCIRATMQVNPPDFSHSEWGAP